MANKNQMVAGATVEDDAAVNANQTHLRLALFTEDGERVNLTDLVGLLDRVQALEDA